MAWSDMLYVILIKGGAWKGHTGRPVSDDPDCRICAAAGHGAGRDHLPAAHAEKPAGAGSASAYIAVLRDTPVLMLLLLLYYGVFARAGLKPVAVAQGERAAICRSLVMEPKLLLLLSSWNESSFTYRNKTDTLLLSAAQRRIRHNQRIKARLFQLSAPSSRPGRRHCQCRQW